MLRTQPNEQGQTGNAFITMLRTSSRKIVAVGASLKVWLRAVERITFTREVSHTPDPELIEELTAVLLATAKKPRLDD